MELSIIDNVNLDAHGHGHASVEFVEKGNVEFGEDGPLWLTTILHDPSAV